MTAKRQLSDQVPGGIKESSACFSRDTIQAAAREAEINALVRRLFQFTPREIAPV